MMRNGFHGFVTGNGRSRCVELELSEPIAFVTELSMQELHFSHCQSLTELICVQASEKLNLRMCAGTVRNFLDSNLAQTACMHSGAHITHSLFNILIYNLKVSPPLMRTMNFIRAFSTRCVSIPLFFIQK